MALGDPGATQRGGAAAVREPGGTAYLLGTERLPCGRLVGEVWERARDGAVPSDAHMESCPYCRGTVEDLAVLDAAVRALRAERPSGRTVADRVMSAVRAEGRLGRLLPLDDPEPGLRIAETAAAAVLRRAADRVPGVRAARCRLLPDDDSSTRRVNIAMTLAMALDAPLTDRAAAVRRAVAHAARRHIGIVPGRIDMRIVSVLEPAEPTAPTTPSHHDAVPSREDTGTPHHDGGTPHHDAAPPHDDGDTPHHDGGTP